jgi:hypothetical protein
MLTTGRGWRGNSGELTITLPGLTWRVWIWPTVGAILADKLSVLPFVVLLMGLVTTVSLASLAYFAQTAQVRATQLARAGQSRGSANRWPVVG